VYRVLARPVNSHHDHAAADA